MTFYNSLAYLQLPDISL